MGYVIVAVVVIVVVIVLAAVLVATNPRLRELLAAGSSKAELPYTAKDTLLTKGEAAFYHVLRRVVGDDYVVSMKVRLSDVLTCSREAWQQGHGNRIQSKHLDFVLVEPNTTRILAAIELDDETHRRKSRQDRDEFLNEAMVQAGIPLIRVAAARQYDSEKLAAELRSALARQTTV